MNTPPHGNPVVSLVLEVKKDLRAHIEKDERDTAYIRGAQDEQSVELGKQTVMLSQLLEDKQRAKRLSEKRHVTAIELQTNTKGWIIKGILGLLFTVLGILIHWVFGKI